MRLNDGVCTFPITQHCSSQFISVHHLRYSSKIILQVVVVNNNDTLQKLPNIEGLLSYRADNRKLYLRGKHHWKTMANDGEVRYKNKLLIYM